MSLLNIAPSIRTIGYTQEEKFFSFSEGLEMEITIIDIREHGTSATLWVQTKKSRREQKIHFLWKSEKFSGANSS